MGFAHTRFKALEVRLCHRLWRTHVRKDMTLPYVCIEKRTSAAEAVPLVRQSLPQPLRVSKSFNVLSKSANSKI